MIITYQTVAYKPLDFTINILTEAVNKPPHIKTLLARFGLTEKMIYFRFHLLSYPHKEKG